MRTSYGSILRGSGGNPKAIERAGWSLLKTKVTMFALAGFFGMLSGLSLIGLTTSAQANVAERYTLYSIAGVILGGGDFVGGRVSPVGAVLGAITLTLSAPFLDLHPHSARLADRRAGRDPDHRARAPCHHRPRGEAAMTDASAASLEKPWLWSFIAAFLVWLATIAFTARPGRRGADDRGSHLRDLLRHRRHRPDVRDHARAGQCRSLDPRDDDARRLGRR